MSVYCSFASIVVNCINSILKNHVPVLSDSTRIFSKIKIISKSHQSKAVSYLGNLPKPVYEQTYR